MDTLAGGGGDDTLDGGAGDDDMAGEAGDDTFLCSDDGDSDTVDGGGGRDTLDLTGSAAGWETAGARFVSGTSEIDPASIEVLRGSDFGDTFADNGLLEEIAGGKGDDTIVADGVIDPADSFDGGRGIDLLDLASLAGGVTVDLGTGSFVGHLAATGFENLALGSGADQVRAATGANTVLAAAGNDIVYGLGGNDLLEGAAGLDTLHGGQGADTLRGGSEADRLAGAGSADVIEGGDGTDRIIGGGGADDLSGEGGADRFIWLAATESGSGAGADLVRDFAVGADLIDLTALGTLDFVGAGAFTGTAAEVRAAIVGGGTRLEIDLDADGLIGAGDMEIVLAGVAGFGAGDLILA